MTDATPRRKTTTLHRNVRVEVSLFSNPGNSDSWSLFANYPNEFEAYDAVDRALEKYPSARLIVEQRFERAKA